MHVHENVDTAGLTPAIQRKTRIACDADDHAQNLSQWEQSYNQFSEGRFKGRVTELWLPKLQIFLETANQALHQSCAAWPDALWFGIPVPHEGVSRLDSRPIANHSLLFRPGGCQFELHTPPGHGIFGIVIGKQLLKDHLIEVETMDPDRLDSGGTLHISPAIQREFIHLLRHLLFTTPTEKSPRSAIDMQEAILTQLGKALSSSTPPSLDRPYLRIQQSRRIVQNARELVLSQPEERLSIAELCRQLHISRRTLQYCFQDIVGLSPLAYLRILKLNQVRRRLHNPRDPARHVTQVATTWGFEHLGQFSRDYRKLFGEPPSATLRQAYD